MTTTTTRTVKRRPTAAKIANIVRDFIQFKTLQGQADAFAERADSVKKSLKATVEEVGYTDDKGHQWFELPEPVEVDGVKYTALQNQRRVTEQFDEDKAREILKRKRLLKPIEEGGAVATIEVLDLDAIKRLRFEGRLTDEDHEAMFPKKISYAFTPQKA